MRTHYDVLGVAIDTPPVVIKAAFRALAKEYHPDGASRQKSDSERFIEIQNAYAILSDPAARGAYDRELHQAVVSAVPPSDTGASLASRAFPVESGTNSFHDPEIQRIHGSLCLYSEALGADFMSAVSEGACGDDPHAYGKTLETNFFREYFGDDPDVQALARLLLLRSRTGAALTLNELVAGGAAPGGKNIALIVSQIIDRHLADEALFAEWLRVKFGADLNRQRAVASSRPSVGAGNSRSGPGQPAQTLRSVGLLCFWAVALYFALFTAFPLLQ